MSIGARDKENDLIYHSPVIDLIENKRACPTSSVNIKIKSSEGPHNAIRIGLPLQTNRYR